jgi:long-chain acyl-CoA synthetase
MSAPRKNLAALLADNARHSAASPAVRHKRRGLHHVVTWGELEAQVERLAGGLSAEGFDDGSLLLTLGELRVEWLLAVLAVHRLGGTVLPVEPEASDEALRAAAETTRARFVLVEGARELERVLALRGALAADARFFFIEPRGIPASQPQLRRLELLTASDQPGELVAVPLAPAFVRFEPAGDGTRRSAAHHGTLLEEAREAHHSLSAEDELWLDASLGFGPERLIGLAAWLDAAARLGLGESPDTRQQDRRELGPTRIVASTEWYEALWRDAERRLPRPGSPARALVSWALRVGQVGHGRFAGFMARVLVLSGLGDALGLVRVQKALLSGAPPSSAVEQLFAALRVPLLREGARPGGLLREPQSAPASAELGLTIAPAAHGE